MLRRDQGAVCSPAIHECCSTGCATLTSQSEADGACGGFDECLELSYCDGEHFVCPAPKVKPNGTLCRGETRVINHCYVARCYMYHPRKGETTPFAQAVESKH